MNKLLKYLLTFALVLNISCSKDEENGKDPVIEEEEVTKVAPELDIEGLDLGKLPKVVTTLEIIEGIYSLEFNYSDNDAVAPKCEAQMSEEHLATESIEEACVCNVASSTCTLLVKIEDPTILDEEVSIVQFRLIDTIEKDEKGEPLSSELVDLHLSYEPSAFVPEVTESLSFESFKNAQVAQDKIVDISLLEEAVISSVFTDLSIELKADSISSEVLKLVASHEEREDDKIAIQYLAGAKAVRLAIHQDLLYSMEFSDYSIEFDVKSGDEVIASSKLTFDFVNIPSSSLEKEFVIDSDTTVIDDGSRYRFDEVILSEDELEEGIENYKIELEGAQDEEKKILEFKGKLDEVEGISSVHAHNGIGGLSFFVHIGTVMNNADNLQEEYEFTYRVYKLEGNHKTFLRSTTVKYKFDLSQL